MADYKIPIITGTELSEGDLLRWNGSNWVNYADSTYSPSSHLHDGDTLQLNAINSDGGAFSFTTTGLVTFNQSIASANYGATNKLTACATNAGALDFSAASKTLTVEDDAVVDQDLTSDASPTFSAWTVSSDCVLGGSSTIMSDTNDGADDAYVRISGGGGPTRSRGGTILCYGNEYESSEGRILLDAGGTSACGEIHFRTGGTTRIIIKYGGSICLGDGGTTDYITIGPTGDQTFTGSAGFYPRVLNQADEPAAGTGATQCDTGELVMWTDTDDSSCHLCYNHSGTVKTVFFFDI